MIECLIRNSANVNAKDNQEHSPLVIALRKGNDNATLQFIENEADRFLANERWGSAYFGCITRNGK